MHVVIASNMRVNMISVSMVVLGLALFVVTMRFWRGAGEDPAVLAPLEIMGDRRFARADEEIRVGLLNDARPEGAEPIEHFRAPQVLDHEPAEQERPFRDPFDHSDDAVDAAPAIIDPLLSQNKEK